MKIVNIIHSIDNKATGPSYSVGRGSESLASIGHSVDVAVLGDRSNIRHENGYTVRYFLCAKFFRKLGISRGLYAWIRNEVSLNDAVIFHSHNVWMINSIYPAFFKSTFVFSPHGALTEYSMSIGSRFKSIYWACVQKPALKRVNCFFATAYSEYRDIRRLGFNQPVAIVPVGMDPSIINVPSELKNKRFVYLGRVHQEKNVIDLVVAWSNISSVLNDWELCIVGPIFEDYMINVNKIIEENAIDRIKFLGPMFGDEKLRFLAESRVFVMPSISENFCIAIAESLSVGTPVICTKGAPWSDIESYECGWWIDFGVEALAKAMVNASSADVDEIEKFSQNAKKLINNKYSWDYVANCMSSTYNWLVLGGETPECVLID